MQLQRINSLQDLVDWLSVVVDHHWKGQTIQIASIALISIFTVAYFIFRTPATIRYRNDLLKCRKDIVTMLSKTKAFPIFVRLAWSDAVSFDATYGAWPKCRGVNGSIRLEWELNIHANAGLSKAVDMLQHIKNKYNAISWADLIQLAAVTAIEQAGGPSINLVYGRLDVSKNDYMKFILQSPIASSAPASGITKKTSRSDQHGYSVPAKISQAFPSPLPPYPDGSPSAAVHIRNVFYRLGLNNKDTVALCGAHTIGRAFKERSGVCPFFSGDQGATIYTKSTAFAHGEGKVDDGNISKSNDGIGSNKDKDVSPPQQESSNVGIPGGCSWTVNWLQFDNSYFKRMFDHQSSSLTPIDTTQLLWLPTDQALVECPEFRPFFKRYAVDQEAFFKDFAIAYKKTSELGSKFQFHVTIT